METDPPLNWCGRVNTLPEQPRTAEASARLFADATARSTYWLPAPPGPRFPELQAFWQRLSSNITEYRSANAIPGPASDLLTILALPAGTVVSQLLLRVNGASHQSRSPNWSGSVVHAVDGNTFTQVVGCWNEPLVATSGPHTNTQEFRSSVWIGFNGHGAYDDAALPQIGTMQQIFFDTGPGTWQTKHWVWFEWWANSKGTVVDVSVLPVYLALDVEPGDTVLCSVELIPSDPLHYPVETFPYVARMCVCVEHLDPATSVLTKVLVMPFIVYPPIVGGRRVVPTGSTANWIAECPANIDPSNPFLLPRFGNPPAPSNCVTFQNCAAAVATNPGQPIFAERGFELSRCIDMFNRQPDSPGSMKKMAATLMPRISDAAFSIQVDGSDP